MNSWILLATAIATEVAATTALKASDGFSRLIPSILVVAGYLVSFWLLSLVLRELPVGLVYAIWSAIGTLGVVTLGILLFGESMSVPKALGIALVIGGVTLLNVAGTRA